MSRFPRVMLLLAMVRHSLVLVLAIAALAACNENAQTPSPAQTVSSPSSTGAAATPDGVMRPNKYCTLGTTVPPEYELEVKANWNGKTITVEGKVQLPGPANVSWIVCQNGQPSSHFQFVGQPALHDGKISGESQVIENPRARTPFDPSGTFDVVVFAQDPGSGLPYFLVGIPVEGNPG